MSTKNAIGFSLTCRLDKLRITLRGWESDRAHQLYLRLINLATSTLGWSEEYAQRHVQVRPYWSSKEYNGYYVQLTYKAATLLPMLDKNLVRGLNMLEVKSYIVPRDDKSFDKLMDDYSRTLSKFNGNVHQNGSWASKSKGGNRRNFKFGSTKSALGGIVYMRPKEFPAIEVSIQGDALQNIIRDVVAADMSVDGATFSNVVWGNIIRRAAVKGYERVEADLRHRGMQLSAHFSHFTDGVDMTDVQGGALRCKILEGGLSMMQGSLSDLLEENARDDTDE